MVAACLKRRVASVIEYRTVRMLWDNRASPGADL